MGGSNSISTIKDANVLLDIIDHLPSSIFVKNEKLQFELSNSAHCDIIGQPAEKLLGFSDADFYPEDQAKGFLERDRAVLETGQTVESVELATSQRGNTIPVFTRKSKLVAPDGKVYLIGTNTDISELHRREEQIRALAQTVPVGVWQVSDSGETVFVNPKFITHAGLPAEEINQPGTLKHIGGTQEDFPGAAQRFETELGDRRLLVISSGWLQLAGNGARSAIISTVDITEMTELKRINDEISRLNRELADNMSKLKEAQDEITRKARMAQLGNLTATVAHEIRNPLGAVRTAAYLIERKIKDKNLGIEPQLQRIANGINRCDSIITQLLDFSRIKALQAETLAFDGWLEKVIEEEARSLPSVVSVRCELGLGALEASFDPTQLGRAVVNLVANASEAMVGKGDDPSKFTCAEPEIVIQTRLKGRGIELVVSDNGPGISAENLAKILEPLFTTKSFGTGLGLPAVEKVAQNHGGHLEAFSELGQGARFTLFLPITNSAAEAA
jgi:PAS domain S-box-containing protein